jgi:hypothetical protein
MFPIDKPTAGAFYKVFDTELFAVFLKMDHPRIFVFFKTNGLCCYVFLSKFDHGSFFKLITALHEHFLSNP